MTGHMPWMKFYPQDWLGEASLRLCHAAARGAWIDLCALMWQQGSADVDMTWTAAARFLGFDSAEEAQARIRELARVADLEETPVGFRVRCRRIARELAVRESDRARKASERETSAECPESVQQSSGRNPALRARATRSQKPDTRYQKPKDQIPDEPPGSPNGDPSDRGAIREAIEAVVAAYRAAKGGAVVTTAARTKVAARLREGWSAEQLGQAIRGCLADPWCQEKGFSALAWICASGERVEMLKARRGVSAADRLTPANRKGFDATRTWLERKGGGNGQP